MASTKHLFIADEHDNEMTFYINDKSKIFLQVKNRDDKSEFYQGFIVLDKEDVKSVIHELSSLLKKMED